MLGKYQPSMSIFALKNWCGWTDRMETQNENRNYDMGVVEQIEEAVLEK
jgi:hypothetical protein